MKIQQNGKRTSFIRLVLMAFLGIIYSEMLSAQIIFENGFENGTTDWSSSGPWKVTGGLSSSSLSSNESREGNKSVLFKNSPDKKRTEFVLRNGKGTYHWGEEYWVGFSLNVLVIPTGNKIISQHHSTPHLLPNGSADWNCTAGPNSFTVRLSNGKFAVSTTTNPSNVNTTPPIGSATWGVQQVLKTYQLNTWYDFVLHYKYALDNTGFIEVWLNGEKIVNKHGTATVYKYDKCGEPRAPRQYQKIGTYYGNGNDGGEILYDAFRIGKGSSVTYEDVAPAGGTLAVEDNAFIDSGIQIYPNPTANEINIQFPETIKVETISIYDVLGKEVFTKRIEVSESKVTLKPNLSKGVYFLKIASDKGVISKKIIIE